MGKMVVAMALLPAEVQRGSTVRADLRYATYSRATWEWWCARNGVEFVALDRPLGDGVYEEMSPSFRRWLAAPTLIDEYGQDARIALIDADTMIRWDAPNLFDAAGDGFAAVADTDPNWVDYNIRAYQPLFPGVHLPWWEYFNSGVVVLGAAQLPTIAAFLELISTRWPELRAIQQSSRVGADQTPLNFVVRREGQPVTFIPAPFNLVQCVPSSPVLWTLERGAVRDPDPLVKSLLSSPDTFNFINYGYIWHFTNVVKFRRHFMEETWRRVQAHYPSDPSD
jgi:hypothetical protein